MRAIKVDGVISTQHPLYGIWKVMRQRCYSPSFPKYKNYGARGIKICERWHSFPLFVKDMGPRPDGMSIDRIDNDGDYCPENCRWATLIQQQNNTSSNRVIEFNGESRTMAEWSRHLKMNYGTLQHRLDSGWGVEKSLTTPVKGQE